jgi:hypothetical protein
MLSSQINLTGELIIEHYDENHKLLESRHLKNLVVTAGKNFVVSRMADTSKNPMTHMGVGSNSTSALLANTALGSQISTRVYLNSTTYTGPAITYTTIFSPGMNTGTWYEAGIFNASSSGDMLCRTTFALLTKANLDTVVIQWVVTLN